ncbi:unnamed protein product [Rhizophagus irregularis]|nr:unnamed protein product [Rhizophagus irregularis]
MSSVQLKDTNAHSDLVSFKDWKSDYDWIIHRKCATHGDSYKWREEYFNHIDDKDAKKTLDSKLKSVMNSKSGLTSKDYIDIATGKNKAVTGAYYFFYSDVKNNERRVFIALVSLSKKPAPDHSLLKEYYEGNENRVLQALMYMLYQGTKSRKMIEGSFVF